MLPAVGDAEGAEVYAATVAASSSHCARLLDVFSQGEADGLQSWTLLVFELADATVADFLAKIGRAPVDGARMVAVSVARGLRHLLQRGLCHGDVKSANVFLHGGPGWHGVQRAVLGDFGSCFASDQDCRRPRQAADIGTPRWRAPELEARPPIYGPCVDAYGLGLVLLALAKGDIGGAIHFQGEVDEAAALYLPSIFESVGYAAARAIRGLLAVEPGARWSVDDFLTGAFAQPDRFAICQVPVRSVRPHIAERFLCVAPSVSCACPRFIL